MKLIAMVFFVLVILAFFAQEKQAFVTEESWQVMQFPPFFRKMLSGNSAGVKTEWITQNLDNFNDQNTKTWQMRYMVNDQYFIYGGPIFIFVGGEQPITAERIANGIVVDLAKEHKAILFHTEHRYYGDSQPTADLSIENLQYLNVRQVLADLANFITVQRKDIRMAMSKVILFGCSYAGNIAVWFSELYPHMVNGVWATSAPLLARVDFMEYNEVVGKAIKALGSQSCYNRIRKGIEKLEIMFAGQRFTKAAARLNLCSNFNHTNILDIWSLFSAISNTFGNLVQQQKGADISNFCNTLMSYEDALSAVTSFAVIQLSHDNFCIDVTYKTTRDYYMNVLGADRAWQYQTCNEFGAFQTSASTNQPFGSSFPLAFYTTLCSDIFGKEYNHEHIYNAVTETNKFFGGPYPGVKNIYMTYGGLDPWRKLGADASQGAAIIPSASHCSDLGSISSSDSFEMRASKKLLFTFVREWLA